jgi:hypothetical protein
MPHPEAVARFRKQHNAPTLREGKIPERSVFSPIATKPTHW